MSTVELDIDGMEAVLPGDEPDRVLVWRTERVSRMFITFERKTHIVNEHKPFSSSVTTHSSRAPEGLWTLASILPCAPFRHTAKDAG